MRAESRGVYDTRASYTTGVGGVGQRVNRWSQRPSAATILAESSVGADIKDGVLEVAEARRTHGRRNAVLRASKR